MTQRKSPQGLMGHRDSLHSNKPLSAAAESTVHDGLDSKDEPGDFIETNCHWVGSVAVVDGIMSFLKEINSNK